MLCLMFNVKINSQVKLERACGKIRTQKSKTVLQVQYLNECTDCTVLLLSVLVAE